MPPQGAGSRTGLAAVLREAAGNAGLRRLQISSALWQTGDAAYVIGLIVAVNQVGGVGAVALLAAVRSLPALVVIPAVTSAAAAIPLDTQLRVALTLRVVTVAALTVAFVAGAGFIVLLLLAAIDTSLAILLRPIRSTLVPAVARSPEELVAANVATTAGDSAGALIGPALAAILLILSGPVSTFVAGTTVLIAATVVALPLRTTTFDRPTPNRDGGGFWREISGGVRDLRQFPHARLIVAVFVAQRFVRGALAVLIVAASVDVLSLGEPGIGWLTAAIGFGGVLGTLLSFRLVSQRRLVPTFRAGVLAWGIGIALVGFIPVPAAALAAFTLAGVGKIVLDPAGFSLIQRTVPTASRGRVLGALEGLAAGSLAVGSLVAAWLVSVLGPAGALIAAGAIPIVAVVLVWLPLRSADDIATIPHRELQALRAVPLFRPLGLNSIEGLARAVQWVAPRAGVAVVRESEPGDRFYVVETGRLSVTSDGRPVRELGPADSFGEIALLHGRPRTASVLVLEDATLASIDGEAFLGAVNGHPESTAAATAVACERLAAAGR